MKPTLSYLIDDFQEREWPQPVPRDRDWFAVQGKADVVVGMRRVGKTWFCYQKMRELMSLGISRARILYLNFEDDRLFGFDITHFQQILDVYYGKYPENRGQGCYFFFDEIQRIDGWEQFIRRLLDTEQVQVCLTGSSSKLLSTDIATSLRGRSLSVEIFPLGFEEFLVFHGLFAEKPGTFGATTAAKLRKAAADYLDIGGFPEVQGLEPFQRLEILQGYVDVVLLKDVVERHQVGNVTALKHLVRAAMAAPGGKFSVNRFYNRLKSMAVKCTKNHLYDYLDHLTDAFVFFKVPLHTRSEKARTINPPKIYTIDTGLLNAMTFRHASDRGPLLETLVCQHLRRRGFELEYVATKDGYETDFLARHPTTGEVHLVQVCWDMSERKTAERELRGLKSAMAELGIRTGTIVTWDDETGLDGPIHVTPAWKWLLT